MEEIPLTDAENSDLTILLRAEILKALHSPSLAPALASIAKEHGFRKESIHLEFRGELKLVGERH